MFKYFKQKYNTWKINKELIKITKSLIQYKINRKECIALLTLLDVAKFIDYNPYNGISVTISVRYYNIEILTDKLISTNYLLRKGSALPLDWDNVIEKSITLDRFFISNDTYLDITKSVIKFKKQALLLCELMKDSDTEEFGIHDHNRRMLTNIFNNIIKITISLIKI